MNRNGLFEEIKKYNLFSLLQQGSGILLHKFVNKKPYENIMVEKGEITFSAWDISDINYYSIMHTHDFISTTCTDAQYVNIVNCFLEYDNLKSQSLLEDATSDEEFILLTIWGLARKQFWYQDIARVRTEFNRQVEILEKINDNTILDLNYACFAETGFNISEYRLLLFTIAAIAMKNNELTHIDIDKTITKRYPFITIENIFKVRSQLSANYTDIRKSPFKEEVFYIYPIIKSINNRYLCVNQYMLFRKISDGPLWAIRNFYKNHESKKFMILYGNLFEKYVSKLLFQYIPVNLYSRIIENNETKLADWFVYTPTYRLIIEQKAFFPELALVSRYTQKDKLYNYIEKYSKAFIQLDSTEQKYPCDKKTLKIILHHDIIDIANGLVKKFINDKISNQLKFTSDFYFMDINSFERLLKLYKKDVNTVDQILTEKKENSEGNRKDGYEFDQLLHKYEIEKKTNSINSQDYWSSYFYEYATINKKEDF